MRCSKCGTEFYSSDFCPNCGERIDRMVKKRGLKPWMVVVIAILGFNLLLILGMVLLFFMGWLSLEPVAY